MLDVHHANAFLVIAICASAGVVGLLARRRGGAGRGVTHLLALAQTLVVAQVLLGLLLLADHKRAHDKLHYAYGLFALCAVFAPWLYAPADPRRRLLWFSVAMLFAAALGVRAYMTAT
jgi:hypothetical protein